VVHGVFLNVAEDLLRTSLWVAYGYALPIAAPTVDAECCRCRCPWRWILHLRLSLILTPSLTPPLPLKAAAAN